ncbi:MAG: polyphosphate kinase 1, partial [Elusimicrobiota bacterium]
MSTKIFIPTLPYLLAAPGRAFIHRDLSGFQFIERVLAEARSSANPLLERAKFLAISSSNLDEFFMIRYASLDRSVRASKSVRDRAHLIRVRSTVLEMAAAFTAKQAETLDLIGSGLEARGVRVVRSPEPGTPAYDRGRALFERKILSQLPPPEPFRPGSLAFVQNVQAAALFAGDLWFRVPVHLPPVFVEMSDGPEKEAWIFFLDDLLAAHLGPAFRLPGEPGFLRLTRDGDVLMDLEEDASVSPDVVRSGLGSRDRGRPVRLQYAGNVPGDVINRCLSALRLLPRQAFPAPGALSLHGLWSAVNQLPEDVRARPGLALPPPAPIVPGPFRARAGLFDKVRERDLLLHHPYDSFDGYVNWMQAACEDPDVESIQQTVYRAGVPSPVLDLLKEAASKKRVRVVIELRARFDELNNLRLADELRRAGAEVAFGFGKLKLHAKLALVARREEGKIALYTHMSTGNYNAATARQYEDLAVLTAHPELGEDARLFFDEVCAGRMPGPFKRLVPAPARLHKLLLQLIQAETDAARQGRPARIIAKMNAVVDEVIVQALYDASRAGVQTDLIVRGACSLVPGVKGLSENIRVISVVDRYLEHSR